MTHEPLDSTQDLLADYLGGEMTASQARAFEARMEQDPALAREALALKQTLQALNAGLDTPPSQHKSPARRPLARLGLAIARYAAVAAVAFFLGSLTFTQTPPAPSILTHVGSVQVPTPTPTPDPDPAPEKLAELHVDSGLAQNLLRIMQ